MAEAISVDANAAHADAPMQPVSFIDLNAQKARVRDAIEARWHTILDHGRYIQGPEVEEVETALSAFTGAGHTIAVGSGTEALVMVLMAMGVGQGDAVFIPGFSYNATANAVILAGAEPVFVDVDRATFNMDPQSLADAIHRVKTAGTFTPRAVISVDLYGLPADYPAIAAAAGGLPIISDAAQSFGGRLDGQWVGAICPITTTSFYPAKALGCFGDGGAIFVDDADLAQRLVSIRWHGTDDKKLESVRVGINGRLDSLQCAVVAEKLKIFDDELQARRRVAAIYEERLDGVVGLHKPRNGMQSGYGLFTIVVDDRDGVAATLKAAGVPNTVYYRMALNTMAAFADRSPAGGLPHCEWLADHVLSIPMHPYMTDQQAHYVCDHVTGAVAG